MTEKFTCEDTQALLDGLSAGTLSDDEHRALRAHAGVCSDCAMLVRIHEHCAELPPDALEAAVPAGMADGMWRTVEARIAERARPDVAPSTRGEHGGTPLEAAPSTAAPRAPARSRLGRGPAESHSTARSWLGRWRRGLVPGLAAAVFVLAFVCGFLVGELRELSQHEDMLVAELAASRHALNRYRMHETASARGRVAGVLTDLGWRRALPAQENYSIEELVTLLEQLPPRTSLLPAGDITTYLGGSFRARGIGDCTRSEQVDMHDGLQAGEAVRLARCLHVDYGTRVSREELVTFIESIIGKGGRS